MSLYPFRNPAAALDKRAAWTLPIALGGRPAGALKLTASTAAASSKRTKIWELASTLHCSVVGTCLSTTELRHVLARLKIPGAEIVDDHQIHMMGVTLAGRHETGGKLLQKALDRRHERTIRHFAKAKDEPGVAALWDAAVQSGDIPGAYWAALTHPAASNALVKKAFGDVHMLSHLVGAANRADIRRLRQLELENAALATKVERQQALLREGFAERDETIRRLRDALVSQVAEKNTALGDMRPPDADLQSVIGDLHERLGAETARREQLDQRIEALVRTVREKEQHLRALAHGHAALQHELELVEAQLASPHDAAPETKPAVDLADMTLLYVGGRPHQIAQLKRAVEQRGGQFLHHDGGIDQNGTLLPGLVSRSDAVFFPVDCISHDAALTIKRVCRHMQKPYRPLRTSSLASFWSGLDLQRRPVSIRSGP